MRIRNDEKIKNAFTNVREHEWQTLNLKNCGLTAIPTEVYSYPDIRTIDLSNDSYCDENMKNAITNIPSEIKNLKNLTKLNVSDNHVKEISDDLAYLNRLKHIDLSNNKLTHLPESIAKMPNLEELKLENNPFDLLPPEIVARGIESIRNFIKELEEKDFLYEVKLLIVGEGRVGKTCISQALINTNYSLSDMDSTEGVNIERWVIPRAEISKINSSILGDFQINIWDFGGQEIYHSTHQFFLTKRSLYLLVTESRKEDSYDDFYYWLNIIKLLGDKSPVVMTLNKCDQPTKDLPINEYKEIFGNIADFKVISLKEGYEDTLSGLRTTIISEASNLPHIGHPLPKVWVDIRKEIENKKIDGANFITRQEYLELCKVHYRDKESALYLSEYFHDLGVIIHFKDDPDLNDTIFLNHEWITKGVYKILDDKEVIRNKGKFNNGDLERIWSDEEYSYKRRELLSLMRNRKFDLCFSLREGQYLVPRLLSVDEIDHNWTSNLDNLKFEYNYKFMPKGILVRLIVKLSEDIFQNQYWRYGVVLKYKNTRAIIKEKYFEHKITIEISGEDKREYLFHIRRAIEEIHIDFNKIEVSEMVPCNCEVCLASPEPHFFDFVLLKRLEINSISEIMCSKSLKQMNVFNLTRDVFGNYVVRDKLVVCENTTAEVISKCKLPGIVPIPERDSSTVFMQIKAYPEKFGLRDRDFLVDSEILRIKSKYPNYYILDYYCIENYLYHPENINSLNLNGFNKEDYISDIIAQKNQKKTRIISNYKTARKSYQEFKIESDKIMMKKQEELIIDYLESNSLETFFKSYSIKDQYNKEYLSQFNIKKNDLITTSWFKDKMINLLKVRY